MTVPAFRDTRPQLAPIKRKAPHGTSMRYVPRKTFFTEASHATLSCVLKMVEGEIRRSCMPVTTRAKNACEDEVRNEKTVTSIPLVFEEDAKFALEVATEHHEFDESDAAHFFEEVDSLEMEYNIRNMEPPPVTRQKAFVLPSRRTIRKKKNTLRMSPMHEDNRASFDRFFGELTLGGEDLALGLGD